MLTDTEIRKTKPQDKPFKMTDSKGLYLLVKPNGGKLWRFDYRFDGKRKTLALGVYPDTSLAKARERLEESRRMLADGVDPCAQHKAAKADETGRSANSFKAVALEYFEVRGKEWSERYRKRLNTDMERDDLATFFWTPGSLMDGYETARRIRRHPNGRDVILIALTGWGQDEDRQRTRHAGFDHHLVKPVDLDLL